jgi:phosphotriesterase-related protein
MKLITTLGDLAADQLGRILPHEHIFVDFRTPEQPGYAQAEIADVVTLMAPELAKLSAQQVTALVDCTPTGVGRRADAVLAVSQAAKLPIVLPTGIYREPWVPAWARAASEGEITDWMLRELREGIEATGVRAAWIKISVGDDGISPIEEKITRAAGRASATTDAAVGSHTIRGRVVLSQLDLLQAAGMHPSRYIAIHANAEADFTVTLALAKRGVWIEYDWIGGEPDEEVIARILHLLDAGYGDQLLLSQDRGWFDPAHPRGAAPGFPKPFTYLFDVFAPKLLAAGVDAVTLWKLTAENPFRAFAR